ncbi:MAG: translocation/assembly module TamB domain-containing protein, partial [Gemmatimonadota bacterium]
ELTFNAADVGTDSLRADARAEGFALDAWGHALAGAAATARWEDGRAELGARATGSAGEVLRVAAGVARSADAYAVHVRELVLGTPGRAWALQGGATARLARDALELDSLALAREDGRGVLSGAGRLAWSSDATSAGTRPPQLDFHAEVRDLPVADWLRLTAADADLSGSVSGRVAVTGSPGAPAMRASAEAVDVRYEDALVERLDGTFSYADRRVEGSVSAVHQGRRMLVGSGTVPLDLRLLPVEERRLAEPLEFAARVDSLPAAMLLGLVDGFRDVSGWVHGDVRAAGTTLEPELGGALALRSAAAVFDPLGVRFGYVNGFFRVEPTGAVAVDLTVQGAEPLGASRPPGQSLGTVRGVVDLSHPRDPELDLTLTAAELLAVSRRDVQAVVSGQLTVGGRYSRPEVAGALRVNQGVLDVDELYRQYQVVQLETPLLFAAVDTNLVAVRQFRTLSPFLRNLRVDSLVVSVGSNAWLRGRDINVELAGDLNVSLDRQTEDIRLTGTLNAQRGTYQLYYGLALARRFDIRAGTVEFPGTPGIDPNLNMTASYRVRRSGDEPLDVQAVVGGSLQSPRVRLTSSADPPISESDLASYLFFGVPTYALRGYANTNASAEGRNVAGLGSQLLAPTAYGLFSTGLQSLSQSLGFFDYVGLSAAEALPGQDFLANTQLEIGFYVTPDVFISYEQRLASREPGVRLEWRASPAFTAEIFAEDRFARAAGTFGLGQAIAPRRVYGFLLFREWGY